MKYLILAFLIILLLYPLTAQARIRCRMVDLPGERTIAVCELINRVEDILFVLGLGLAVIVIIFSGIRYAVSGGDQTKMDQAKKTLIYGLVGAAIILLAVFLINLLDEVIISALGGTPSFYHEF